MLWKWIQKISALKNFYDFSGRALPWLITITLVLFIYGLIGGLLLAPPDYQQGDAFRIIYIHVPNAAMSLCVYTIMTVSVIINFVWKIKLADVVAKVSAPLGALFTALALITGSIWGKPMWGTWWIWDARLTSELILLFIYFGIIALRQAITEPELAAKATGILTLVGFVDLPIIHYSVYWWNTLHQQPTLLKFAKPSIAPSMLYPLLAMLAAFFFYYLTVMFLRARREILRREKRAKWVLDIGGRQNRDCKERTQKMM